MVKKRSLKSARKTRKISKQKGGILCNVPNSRAFFENMSNSCYFDTAIIGWLHAADLSLRRYLVRMYKISPEDDPRKNICKRLINIYDLLHLNPKGIRSEVEAVTEATRIREILRDTLQSCPLFKGFNLKNQQLPEELFINIMHTINIQNILTNTSYRNDPKYPSAPKRDNTDDYMDILYLTPLNSDFNTINPSDLLNNIFTKNTYIVNDESKMKYKTHSDECDKNPNNCSKYIINQRITGTLHGILPISVDRKNPIIKKDGSLSYKMDEIKINLEPSILLKSSNKSYELVSIICHSGGSGNSGHYTAYYKCNDGINWIFYNDLGVRISRGGGNCEDKITNIVIKNYSNKQLLIEELNKTFCNSNVVRTPANGNFPGLQSAIKASLADKGKYIREPSVPLYINIGPIESWQDKPSPGLRLTPRQSAVLLFYKRIPANIKK